MKILRVIASITVGVILANLNSNGADITGVDDSWTIINQTNGASFQFSIKEFAGYQSEMLPGYAAIIVMIAPVNGRASFEITKNSAAAALKDGSIAGLKAFRIFADDTDAYSLRRQVHSTNTVESTEMIDDKSRIGNYTAGRYVTFGLPNDLGYTFDASGTNMLTLGLIFDAQVPDIKSVTFFGKTMPPKFIKLAESQVPIPLKPKHETSLDNAELKKQILNLLQQNAAVHVQVSTVEASDDKTVVSIEGTDDSQNLGDGVVSFRELISKNLNNMGTFTSVTLKSISAPQLSPEGKPYVKFILECK